MLLYSSAQSIELRRFNFFKVHSPGINTTEVLTVVMDWRSRMKQGAYPMPGNMLNYMIVAPVCNVTTFCTSQHVILRSHAAQQ